MYAKITKDLLYDNKVVGEEYESREGLVLFDNKPGPIHVFYKCRLYDDDGEIYYEADADDAALELLFDWAQKDAGVTLLKIKADNGEWEDCIG